MMPYWRYQNSLTKLNILVWDSRAWIGLLFSVVLILGR